MGAGRGVGVGGVDRKCEEFPAVPSPSSLPCLAATKQSERPEELMDTLRNSNRSLLASTASISQKSLHKILNRNLGGVVTFFLPSAKKKILDVSDSGLNKSSSSDEKSDFSVATVN